MEDLRWILLLVGGLVVAAVYFSSRFEREDWVREREEQDTRQRPQDRSQNHSQKHIQQRPQNRPQDRPQQKAPQQDQVKARVASEAPRPGASSPRKEPQMSSLDVVAENSSEPAVSTAGMIVEQDPATPLDSAVGSTVDAAVDSTVNSTVNTAVNATVNTGRDSTVNAGKDSIPDTTPDSTLDTETGLRKTEAVTDQQSSSDLSEAEATPEPNETGQPEVVTAAAVSEIPLDAALPEESVTTREKTRPAAQNSNDDVHVEDRLLASAIDAGIEDEITGVDIPLELMTAEAEIQIENHRRETPEPTTQKTAPSVNIEPLVLVITVMAEDENFSGPAVREALEAEGLEYGEMRIFHYFDRDAGNASNNEKPENIYPVFSVASLVEPGYFVLEKLQEMEMPGLTLFCQLPGSLPGEKAFEIMLDKGRGLAVRLHGQMCDDKHNRFTTQAKTHYQDRIATYSRKLALARKKSGV
ncbi:MAG: cell division protein ZipA C-terminal FtsZ-binding domain-containing protein [Gammaproteobacteria bacterium]|nr:cell division protein ZipA C-terminal FtsZ-binding domain-containing protein [Gammaproteobacteria bacterium]